LPKANAYYRRTQAGAELDLLLFLKGRRIGVEIKRADAPKMTPSMVSALKDLELPSDGAVNCEHAGQWTGPY